MTFNISDRRILEVVHGSRAYGTHSETSDYDLRGVIIPPASYFLGLDRFDHSDSPASGPEAPPSDDVMYYDIRKFAHLCLQGNPNAVELLYAPTRTLCNQWGELLVSSRDRFLAKSMIRSHIGMADAHLKKLGGTNRHCGVSGKACIEAHGYNTKDAAHVLRVLGQMVEVLKTETLTLPRPNAEFLREVRSGAVGLKEVTKEAEELKVEIRSLEETSPLRRTPDREFVQATVMSAVEDYLWFHGELR